MAIGGFVVGASAMAVIFGLHNAVDDEKVDSLRGYSSSSAPEIDTSDMVNIVVPSNFIRFLFFILLDPDLAGIKEYINMFIFLIYF